MRTTYWLIAAGAALFLGGAAIALSALYSERLDPAGLVVALLAGAALVLMAAVWRLRHRADWGRVGAEQRLWESGPLGRAWLKIRQRLSRR